MPNLACFGVLIAGLDITENEFVVVPPSVIFAAAGSLGLLEDFQICPCQSDIFADFGDQFLFCWHGFELVGLVGFVGVMTFSSSRSRHSKSTHPKNHP